MLRKISDATSIQIITNTGFYGAADDRYIPELAYNNSAEYISKIWIDEFKNGIKDSGIKPGFIKLAFDDDKPVSEIDKKLFEAGVLTHLSTGLTMAVHTGKNFKVVAFQKELLDSFNVDLGAWIWTHANKLESDSILIELATEGAWISLDGVKESIIDEYVNRILKMISPG